MRFQSAIWIQLCTVRIEVDGGWGSGVLLDKEGHIATCAHVVHDVEDGFLSQGDLQSQFTVCGRGDEEKHDIAILKSEPNIFRDLEQVQGFKLPIFETHRLGIHNGEVVGICGYPAVTAFEKVPVLGLGMVAVVRHPVGPIMVGGLAYPGNSGGPCFDTKGVVLGLVSANHPAMTIQVAGEREVNFPASYCEIYPGSTIEYVAKKSKVKISWKTQSSKT
jgi:hypothetical protein